MIKTVNLSSDITAVEISGKQNVTVRNVGSSTAYISTNPELTAGSDGTMTVKAGEVVTLEGAATFKSVSGKHGLFGTIYAFSSGSTSLELIPTNSVNFKSAAEGSEGGGDVSAILSLIPTAATPSNQLADKAYIDNGLAAKLDKETDKSLVDNNEIVKLATLENYTLPAATSSTLGGVIVGSGLSVTDGVLSASGGSSGSVNVDEELSDNSENPVQNKAIKAYIDNGLANKVDKETGKSLVDDNEIAKLATLENYTLPAATSSTLGGVIVGSGLSVTDGVLSASGGSSGSVNVDEELSDNSENPVQNKAIKAALDELSAEIPSKVSQLTNDKGYITSSSDYRVQNYVSTSDGEYPVVLAGYTNDNATTYTSTTQRANGVYVNPSTNTVTAAQFNGNLNGTASEATFARTCYQIAHTPESGYYGTSDYLISTGDEYTPIYLKDGTFWTCTAVAASTATFATKLGSSTVGSSTLPIYLSGGSPTACSSSLAVSITGTAAKATADASGNTITSTYATKSSLSSYATTSSLSSYMPLSGGTFSGTVTFGSSSYTMSTAGKMYCSDIVVRGTGAVCGASSGSAYCGKSANKWANVYTTQINGSAADYAEYFEWSDGNPLDEDRRGLFVTLSDGEKISLAAEDDDVLGIISAFPLIIGDDISDEWQGKYKRDIFGAYVRDEDGNRIISDEYDDTQEYIPRSDRKEWDVVGLLGKIVMVDDGSCVVGGYCKPCADGSGRAAAADERTSCRCTERIDDTHVKVFFKE